MLAKFIRHLHWLLLHVAGFWQAAQLAAMEAGQQSVAVSCTVVCFSSCKLLALPVGPWLNCPSFSAAHSAVRCQQQLQHQPQAFSACAVLQAPCRRLEAAAGTLPELSTVPPCLLFDPANRWSMQLPATTLCVVVGCLHTCRTPTPG